MNYQDIAISDLQAEKKFLEFYGLKGKATFLPGEIDFNFLLTVKDGAKYIFKISRPQADSAYLNFQEEILTFLSKADNLKTPEIVKNLDQKTTSTFIDQNGHKRYVRVLRYIDGRLWSKVNPKSESLRFSLGQQCGIIANYLQGFDHDYARRELQWDIAQSLWTKDYRHLFEGEKREIVEYFQNRFEDNLCSYSSLRKSIIHNDANDNNIIVNEDLLSPSVKTMIDFGDAIYSQTINDLAVCSAYAIMDFHDPLDAGLQIVEGFNTSLKLTEEELEHLYCAIAMRLVISVTKSAINRKNEPDNTYLLISEKPAWEVLRKWKDVSCDFAHFSFRKVCGYTAHPHEDKFKKWARNYKLNFTELIPSARSNEIFHLDLSVGSTWAGHERDLEDLELFDFKIRQLQKEHPTKIIAGGYSEPRAIYNSSAYNKQGNSGIESRTIHMGIDYWFPALTPIHAIYEGEVVTAVNDVGNKEYGGLVILEHKVEDWKFYSLYAHNTPESAIQHKVGDFIKKGEKITELGDYPDNGNWSPHLHFQVMLSMLDYKFDFPGVVYFNQLEVWKSIIPDPNLLFKSVELNSKHHITSEEILKQRSENLGKSLSLQYKKPLNIVRGSNQFLVDESGRKYLDTVNNVAHVGHENYNVVRAGQEQMAILNTNTRYLNENITELATELLETFPPELSVVHFVNSGSEANELALRMVKAFTGSTEMIVSEVGYHGNTNAVVDISSYKFEGKGGKGAISSTHVFPLPDTFRGKYRGLDSSSKYIGEIEKIISKINSEKKTLGGFIVEPIISCGGQIELPEGFLKAVYKIIKKAGGLCISDEVQTGCGRMGKTFWGFQLHDVIPDIVTIGKPLGNGHPVAAVVCTREVAEKFVNGMEYFNTFGGNPVSCKIASEVLKEVRRENLQANALKVGEFLKTELKKIAKEYPIIGDVRGQGLFLGMELVDQRLNALPQHTEYLINRMKDYGILMSSDGREHNVIKFKPPLTFSVSNAKELLLSLKQVLSEDYMQIKNL